MKAVRNVLYSFDLYTVDVAEGRLWRDKQLVALTPKAFDTLLVLLAHRGNVVNKDTLLDEVWKDTFVEESTLAQNISTLRKALGTLPGGEQFIETVPRRGYRFTADVKEIIGEDEIIVVRRQVRTQISSEDETASAAIVRHAGRSLSWAKRNWLAATALAAIAVLLITVAGLTLRSALRPARMSASAFTNTAVTKLTSDGEVDLVQVSPDGHFIAMVEKRGANSSVVLRQIDNSTTIGIVPAAPRQIIGLSFAPDGKQVYFAAYNQATGSRPLIGNLYMVSTLGGPVQEIASDVDSAIAISADNHKYAFIRNDLDKKLAAIVIRSFGSNEEQTLSSRPLAKPYTPSGLAWSPDGKTIAAISRVDNAQFEIVAVETAGGKEVTVSPQRWDWIGSPHWLRDGSGLIVSAFSSGSHSQTDEIWVVPFPDGKPRRIADGTSGIYGLSLTADSESLVAVKSQMVSTLWAGNSAKPADATKIKGNLPDYNMTLPGANWTADDRIVYGSTLNGNTDIWIMSADGSTAQQLTTDPAVDSQPVVSADGGAIFFVSNRLGTRDLFRMRLDGSDQQPLTRGEMVSSPSLSADGKQIYYASLDKQTQRLFLRRISVEGGESSQITSTPTVLPQISPDGTSIACWYPAREASGEGGRDLVLTILSAESGDVLKQFDANFRDSSLPIKWSDSRNITYSMAEGRGSRLWKQPVEGGAPQLLIDSPNERILRVAWSAEAKRVFFEKGTVINDVILVTSRETL